MAELRRQLSAAINQLQQLKQNSDKLKRARDKEGPPRSGNQGYGRQNAGGGYERKDSRNYRDRENRSPQDRSPSRRHKGYMASRSRSRSRSRESRADESSSRHYARRIRVLGHSLGLAPRKDQLNFFDRFHDYLQWCLVRFLLNHRWGLNIHAEVIQPDMPSATTNLPTKMVSIPKTQGPVRPERSVLIKWAYGTGTADQEEDDYDAYKMWETHCDNQVANLIWREEVMSIRSSFPSLFSC